jgi:hypothetical protein
MLLEQRRPNLDTFDGIGRPRWRRDVLFENRPRHGLALCRLSPNSGDSLGLVDIVGGHGKVSILESILEAHANLSCHGKSRPFSIIVTRFGNQIKSNPTLRFSCGARSAFKLKGRSYLRNMLSRRPLQAIVELNPPAGG